jgi:hypothetical protein
VTTNRKKGHDFERRVVAAFRSHGFPKAIRHDESIPGAILGYDIDHTGPFRVQCKRLQNYAPISNIFEIPNSDAYIPLLITQPDDGKAMAVLPFSAFLQLISGCMPKLKEEF